MAVYEQNQKPDDPLRGYRDLVLGGDPQRGRVIFWERAEAQCLRCHKVAGKGEGLAGPDLGDIGLKSKPEELLESIIYPNRKITEGYDSVVLELENGEFVTGVLVKQEGRDLFVANLEGVRKINKGDIQSQRRGLSPMPAGMHKLLKRAELRDLVAYLASLKTPAPRTEPEAR